MKTIGLDIGTTSISMVVLDTEKQEIILSRTIPNGCFITTENGWERIQDAEKLIGKAKALLDEIMDETPDAACVGMTGQMHGIVYLNEKGESISPLYTWQDGRGDLSEDGKASVVQDVRDRFGLPVASGYGLTTHLYHVRHGMVPQDAAFICTIMDYLGMRLTGRKRPLTHTSNAASFGFFDVRNGVFFTDILRECGIDPAILPDVSGNVEVLGTYRGIPVTIALGDNQASFLGAAGLEDGAWLLNVGTGGQISVLSDVFFEAPGIEARPYLEGKYLLAGSTLCCGRAYAILEKFFRAYAKALGQGDQEQYGVMQKLLEESGPDPDPMCVVTKFSGTRVDPGERGSITNVSENNFTPAGMVRGVLTGMSQELYDWYGIIHDGTGIPVNRLLGSGNGVRKNRLLQEIFTEMFESPISLSRYEEEAAGGAATSCLFAKSSGI